MKYAPKRVRARTQQVCIGAAAVGNVTQLKGRAWSTEWTTGNWIVETHLLSGVLFHVPDFGTVGGMAYQLGMDTSMLEYTFTFSRDGLDQSLVLYRDRVNDSPASCPFCCATRTLRHQDNITSFIGSVRSHRALTGSALQVPSV